MALGDEQIKDLDGGVIEDLESSPIRDLRFIYPFSALIKAIPSIKDVSVNQVVLVVYNAIAKAVPQVMGSTVHKILVIVNPLTKQIGEIKYLLTPKFIAVFNGILKTIPRLTHAVPTDTIFDADGQPIFDDLGDPIREHLEPNLIILNAVIKSVPTLTIQLRAASLAVFNAIIKTIPWENTITDVVFRAFDRVLILASHAASKTYLRLKVFPTMDLRSAIVKQVSDWITLSEVKLAAAYSAIMKTVSDSLAITAISPLVMVSSILKTIATIPAKTIHKIPATFNAMIKQISKVGVLTARGPVNIKNATLKSIGKISSARYHIILDMINGLSKILPDIVTITGLKRTAQAFNVLIKQVASIRSPAFSNTIIALQSAVQKTIADVKGIRPQLIMVNALIKSISSIPSPAWHAIISSANGMIKTVVQIVALPALSAVVMVQPVIKSVVTVHNLTRWVILNIVSAITKTVSDIVIPSFYHAIVAVIPIFKAVASITSINIFGKALDMANAVLKQITTKPFPYNHILIQAFKGTIKTLGGITPTLNHVLMAIPDIIIKSAVNIRSILRGFLQWFGIGKFITKSIAYNFRTESVSYVFVTKNI
jgi:hypothetical protein